MATVGMVVPKMTVFERSQKIRHFKRTIMKE